MFLVSPCISAGQIRSSDSRFPRHSLSPFCHWEEWFTVMNNNRSADIFFAVKLQCYCLGCENIVNLPLAYFFHGKMTFHVVFTVKLVIVYRVLRRTHGLSFVMMSTCMLSLFVYNDEVKVHLVEM